MKKTRIKKNHQKLGRGKFSIMSKNTWDPHCFFSDYGEGAEISMDTFNLKCNQFQGKKQPNKNGNLSNGRNQFHQKNI